MDTNFKAETPLTEDEARARYTKALTAFNRKCTTVEELRKELEEESVELTRLKGKVDQYSGAFLRAVERQELERKDDMPEAYEKADALANVQDEARAEARALTGIDRPLDVSEADRDETAIAAEEDEAELAIPSPGQRRAENITNLTPEREALAMDVLETVDNILSDD